MGKPQLRKGPPHPGGMAHPSGRHPVFTKGRGTSMCHLGHIPRARRPFANVKVVASIVKAPGKCDGVLPRSILWRSSVFGLRSSVRAGSHRTVGCEARQPRERSAAQHAPKDAVLPYWGSSGTWRCRAREMRHGRRSERRPPWRQNGGPHRSRRFHLPEPML